MASGAASQWAAMPVGEGGAVSSPAAAENVPARTTAVAAEGECRRIVLDVQTIMRQLSKTNKAKLDDIAAGPLSGDALQSFALGVPTTKPLSIFNAATWSACFTEFFYGDCTPRLERRPVYVSVEELFAALSVREELQYHLETDEEAY